MRSPSSLAPCENMVAGLKSVFFRMYANISSIEGTSEGKSLGGAAPGAYEQAGRNAHTTRTLSSGQS